MEWNVAAVQTSSYLCALAMSHHPFTGHYYSLLASAAAFIAFNKYNTNGTKESTITFPEAFEKSCGYGLKDLKPIVKELIRVAIDLEQAANDKFIDKRVYAISVYKHYLRTSVVTTHNYPDFDAFFEISIIGEAEDEAEKENEVQEKGKDEKEVPVKAVDA